MKKHLFYLLSFTLLFAAKNIAQNPTILSFTPTSTCQGKSIPVFITGANLIGATAVKVGGIAVDSFKVNDSTSITAYISRGTAGKITVTTPKGTATSSSLFSYNIGHYSRAYIADDSLILVIDVPADTIITSIDLGYNWPSNITASPDGTKIYFSNYNGIGVVNTATHVFKNYQINISNPMRMDISPEGTKLYVVSFNSPVGSLSVINTSNFQLIKRIPLGSYPGPLGVSADGNRVVVYNNSSNSVSIINAQNNTVVATVPIYSTLNGSGGICMSPDGTKAYVVGGDIVVIDLINNAIIRTIPAGNTPGDICISPDGQKLFLVSYFDNDIKVINTKNFAVTSVTSGIPNPYSVTLSPDGKQLFVCGNNCNGLAVINTSTNSLNKIISFPHNTMYSRPWGRFIANLPEVCPLPKPVIKSFKTPASTGTKDTIKGKAFTGATTVSFGGVAASSFTVINDSTIMAVVGAGASGFVKVTTLGGSDSLGGFIYIKKPVINSFKTPASIGTKDTIRGKAFTGTTAVSFGGAASSFKVINDSTIMAVVGAGASGFVKVTTSGGSDSLGGFIYVKKPVINSFKTPASSGTKDTIKGKALTGATAVSFGGVAASSFKVINDSTIMAVVGAGASGFVKVTTMGGSDSLGGFSFIRTLPITLSSFIAIPTSKSIRIEWQSKSAGNTAKFNIEHSTDGSSFTEIGTVKAIGDWTNSYTFLDNDPMNGINYYRLQIIDETGIRSYSRVVSANFGDKGFFSIVPNPATDYAIITFTKAVEKATIVVYDIKGKAVISQSLSGNANTFKLNIQSLKNGVYVIKVKTPTSSYNEKLVINK